MTALAAIDLGATSGRVIVGDLDEGRLRLRSVARFPNTPVRLADGLHWDVVGLYAEAMRALGTASRADDDLVGAAIDGWAVDYGLVAGRSLVGVPFHYRDPRTRAGVERVHAIVGADELYRCNGLQHLPFTTLFPLAVDPFVERADTMLLLPDLLGWWATGTAVAERTNASTTGLLALDRVDWDRDLVARLGLPAALLPPLVDPGTDLGAISDAVSDQFGIAPGLHLSTVGSHDTASAVVGIPLVDEGSVYISCGTWSLVGAELSEPLVTGAAREAGFTNEGGVDGRTRFLTNVMGLWLLSESIRTWERRGERVDLDALLGAAADASPDVPVFDVDDDRLLAPDDMLRAIEAVLSDAGCAVPASRGALVRSILTSLAEAYAGAVRDIERLTGRTIRTVHLAGGGARNELLCRLTADATGLPVVAGPVEATAIGNLLVQARSAGLVAGDLEALRAVVTRSFEPHRFEPRASAITRRG